MQPAASYPSYRTQAYSIENIARGRPRRRIRGHRDGLSPSRGQRSAAVIRSPIADQARSRVRGEDVGDGSAAEDGGADRLDGERREEEPLARTEDGGVDNKAVLVD